MGLVYWWISTSWAAAAVCIVEPSWPHQSPDLILWLHAGCMKQSKGKLACKVFEDEVNMYVILQWCEAGNETGSLQQLQDPPGRRPGLRPSR